jgi:hypothetical protein
MSADPGETNTPPTRHWIVPLLVAAVIILSCAVATLWWQVGQIERKAELHRASDQQMAAAEASILRNQIEDMATESAQREAATAARESELRQREAAIAGREEAATERTQSSFQGLLIQQQLTKNLEALKASLPDMTPEVERLAREHAQSEAERQRLQKENADLLRRLNPAAPLESR